MVFQNTDVEDVYTCIDIAIARNIYAIGICKCMLYIYIEIAKPKLSVANGFMSGDY